MKKRLTLHIYGNVHGVSFRYHIWNFGQAHSISGWVRNERDGSVAIIAEGNEENLRNLIDFCYNGIKSAYVDKIERDWSNALDEYDDFTIKY